MAAPALKPFKLQVVRLPQRDKQIFTDIMPNMEIGRFQQLLQDKYSIEPVMQSLTVSGIPPRPISTAEVNATMADLGIRAGDSIELRSLDSAAVEPREMQQGKGTWDLISHIPSNSGGFKRREMPADNSCLFHSIAYTCANKKSGGPAAHEMRELAANVVASDPGRYTTVMLGSPNHLYQDHLLNPNSWGGAIELQIFSAHFQTEIIAFDPKALREDVFGDGENYAKRVFLIYTGDHYDAMVFAASNSSGEQVIFNTKDEHAWRRARDYIESLHSDLVGQGKATKTTEWRHNKDLKRKNGTGKSEDAEREKRAAAERAKIAVSSATASSTTSASSSSSSTTGASSATKSAATASAFAGLGEWSCSVCTCVNSISAKRCSACDSANPNAPASSSLPSSSSFSSSAAASTTASFPASTSSGGFNCERCTAWNETPSSRCAVCGTSQSNGAPATADSDFAPPEEDDGVRAPLPQRDYQLLGGEDEVDASGSHLDYGITAQQREILAQEWDCPRCTMHNGAGLITCSACRSPHPNPLLNSSTAFGQTASLAPPRGSSSQPSQPTSLRERFKNMMKPAPQWVCERCGKSQSSQLFCCGNCKMPNVGLQMRLQDHSDQGDCSIM